MELWSSEPEKTAACWLGMEVGSTILAKFRSHSPGGGIPEAEERSQAGRHTWGHRGTEGQRKQAQD